MQLAFLSLVMFAVHASAPADCRAALQESERGPQQQQQQNSVYTVTNAEASTAGGASYSTQRGTQKYLGGQTETGGLVSVFHWWRRRLHAVNLKRELDDSRQKDKADCLFHRLWLDLKNHWGVFDSVNKGLLFKIKRGGLPTAHKEPPEASSGLLDLMVKRTRRSGGVNPSDPLGSQSLPSYLAKHHRDPSHVRLEQDQAGAVSKETIASCDDPLRVLQPNGPVSPIKTNIAEWAEQH